jgi:hypothetical protein
MRDYQKYAITLSLFSVVLYAALVVAAFGMISLFSGVEIIEATDAGPLVGPTMVGVSALIVLVLLVRLGIVRRPEKQHVELGYAFVTGVAAFLGYVATGSLVYSVGDGQLFDLFTFTASTLGAPFAATVGILAFVVALTYSFLLTARFTDRGRPLWPWERSGS